ncbi:MAG: ComF family protein [Aeromicrobium sp.]|nr:ComF family protein [Aeromicrobium sp.]
MHSVPAALHDPVPVVAYAGGANVDVLRRVLVEWKERGVTRLTEVLAHHLAAAAVPHARSDHPVALVPVPTTARSRRLRGADLTDELARAAARLLRSTGIDVVVVQALVHTRSTLDQSRLGAADRRANLDGAMRAASTRRLAGRGIVVVDDILTTGSTAGEVVRALTAVGHRPVGIAVVAATPLIARGDG